MSAAATGAGAMFETGLVVWRYRRSLWGPYQSFRCRPATAFLLLRWSDNFINSNVPISGSHANVTLIRNGASMDHSGDVLFAAMQRCQVEDNIYSSPVKGGMAAQESWLLTLFLHRFPLSILAMAKNIQERGKTKPRKIPLSPLGILTAEPSAGPPAEHCRLTLYWTSCSQHLSCTLLE